MENLQDYLINDHKAYVTVREDRMEDGTLRPLSFIWEDGRRYAIDHILDVRPAASLKAGGCGMRYTVSIHGQQRYMFLEEDHGVLRWFMERK